ncbi:LytTR family DNA-binding domain-containing protein [Thalassotalea euphylliae]|uniref:LytTR family transcriptional regulator n=1 Tax=Thalassotalea euphylliae TaxID=1655234 RepID=A0A3E0UGJ9_9GAMM|nr:LytTR family DNA-binding domain-containing protein [Thalassotalea euphylliae]REL35986.1 LytTR family transcriptional regulator [Thalassotalea euphylliae]
MNKTFPLGDINPLHYFYSIAAITGFLFALISRTENTPVLLHFVIWQLQAIVPMSFLITSHAICLKVNVFNKLKSWQQLLISGLVGSLLFVPLALLIDIYVVGEGIPESIWLELSDEALGVMPPVTIFWFLINFPWLLGFEYQKKEIPNKKHKASNESNQELLPAFLSMTSIKHTDEIVSMSSQLHYLEILTLEDKFLILYSLTKAINELPKSSGIQTHRSHWVAVNHIKSVKKEGRQGEVTMMNNTKIPISRSKLNDVLAAQSSIKK